MASCSPASRRRCSLWLNATFSFDHALAVTTYSLLDLLQITDRSFPTGGFVHSQGLEWLVKEEPVSLQDVLNLRLREQLSRFELVFVKEAYRAPAPELDERFHSMVLPRESREASGQVGRQLLSNACDLFDKPSLWAARGELPHAHHAIAYGVVCRALEVPTRVGASAYAFQAMRAQVSAAQRLTRLGQTEAQRILHRLKPAIEDAVEAALACPIEEALPFAPLLDIAAMGHERSLVRLFVS